MSKGAAAGTTKAQEHCCWAANQTKATSTPEIEVDWGVCLMLF